MLSQLDMVNEMLSATGARAVTSLDTNHPSVASAYNKLKVTSAEVQNLGFWFNSTIMTLSPDNNGEIILPTGTVSIDSTNRRINVTKRGARLYNMDSRNHIFDSDVEVKLVQEISIDDMPETARHYILARARYKYYLDQDGTEPKLSNYRGVVETEWQQLYREHLRNKDTNYFDGNNSHNLFKRNRSGTTTYAKTNMVV